MPQPGKQGWLAESKWQQERKAGVKIVKRLLEQAEQIKEKKELETLRVWLFSYAGVTGKAETLMREHNVLWSTKADLNALLTCVKLRTLPELE